MRGLQFAAACLMAMAPLSSASAQDYSASALNNPDPASLGAYGAQTSVIDDPKVTGGKAFRVVLAAKGANPWDAAVLSQVKQPVKAGDELVLAFWARLVSGENGATSTTLPASVGLASPPWTALVAQPVTVGPDWKLVKARGRADKDYAAGTLNAGVQLATAKQTIDFGPLYVAKLGGGTPGAVAAPAKPSLLASLDPAKIPDMLISDSTPEVNKAKARLVDDPRVMGGKALRVAVSAKGKQDWDSNVSSTIKKPVKAGDKLLFVFWARLEQGPNGATTTTIPGNVQRKSPPWGDLYGGRADIGPEWKRFEYEGTAEKDYAVGSLGVGFGIGQARQTIDFGPILLLDLNK